MPAYYKVDCNDLLFINDDIVAGIYHPHSSSDNFELSPLNPGILTDRIDGSSLDHKFKFILCGLNM